LAPMCDLDPLEMAVEYPFGNEAEPKRAGRLRAGTASRDDVLAVLALPIAELLAAGPVGVLFSGGRDSSALLALATTTAKRLGLAAPAAITCVYPELPDPDELAAQRAVIDAVRPGDWIRIEVRDEQDLLGPAAQRGLRRHGYLYPATTHSWEPIYAAVPGFRLLDGEGGDEVFGHSRATALAHLIRRRGVPYAGRRGQVTVAVAPSMVRKAASRRAARAELPSWLRPAAKREYLRRVASEAAAEPLDWRDAVRRQPLRRGNVASEKSRRIIAADHDVELISPFLAPGFLDVLARYGGRLGFTSRTTAMRELFGDLLPESVTHRHTKANFNNVFCGHYTRDFATKWDGIGGIDPNIVDPDALRACWLSPMPHGASFGLLHQAWLAAEAGQ